MTIKNNDNLHIYFSNDKWTTTVIARDLTLRICKGRDSKLTGIFKQVKAYRD